MKRAWLVLMLVGLALVGWRVVVTSMAAHWGQSELERALGRDSTESDIMLIEAQAQFDAGAMEAATAQAREVLQSFPLQAEALVILARAADVAGDPQALHLFQTALQRSPRSQYARAWVIGEHLRLDHYDDALAQVNVLLGFAPWLTEALLPTLVQISEDPKFAAAVPAALSTHPSWRSAYLDELLKAGQLEAIDAVYGGLQERHDLTDIELGRWFDWLGEAGLWGKAYSQWISWLQLSPGASVALVYNGGFDDASNAVGFGWRMQGGPNVLIERVLEKGDPMVQVTFLGRRTTQIGFAQTVFLAPGRYRLHFRAAARDLRSDRGLQWVVRCRGESPLQAGTEPLQGSFEWRRVQLEFQVPAQGCPAQELVLVNPGARGAGKIVSGTLWLDDFAIDPTIVNSDAMKPDVPARVHGESETMLFPD